MNLILSGRGVDLDDRLREYATEKLSRAERFFDRIIKMEVELRHERNPRVKDPDRVEVTVRTPGETLRVHGEGADHFAAIDQAADRLEKQIKRVKARLKHLNDRNGHREHPPVIKVDDDEAEDGPRIRVRREAPKPLTEDEACLELDERGYSFLFFTDAESMRPAVLYRMTNGDLGLIIHEA